MESIIPTDEFTEIDGRVYANPQSSLDRSNAFIDNLRSAQSQQNQQIATDTYNLGSALPSAQGGLGTNTPANMGYFTSRYQTPQTASAVANLRATAQATALNQALQNEQAIWKKRYQDAYRAYQKRQYDASKTPQNPSTTKGDVEEDTNELTGQGRLVLDDQDFAEGGAYLVEPASGNIIGEGFSGDNPRYVLQADGSYKKYSPASTTGTTNWLDLGGLLTNYWRSSGSNNSTRSGLGGGGW